MTILIISNEEINDIKKIVKSLEESGLFIKGVSKPIRNVAKEQKDGFLGKVSGTLGTSLLENVLPGKSTIRAGKSTIRLGDPFIIKMNLNLMVFIQEIIYLK